MGNARIDHLAGRQMGHVGLHAFQLHAAAAENRRRAPQGICIKACNAKHDRFIDPGNDRDIPHFPLLDPYGRFLARDDSLHAAEIDMQIVILIAQQSACFQNPPLKIGIAQRGGGCERGAVLRCVHQPAFRLKMFHFPTHSAA
jgi:hypothetical protein